MKTYQGFGKNVTPSKFFTEYAYTLSNISKNIVFKHFYTDIIMSIKYTINSSTKTLYTLNAIHEQNPHPDIMNDWKKFK